MIAAIAQLILFILGLLMFRLDNKHKVAILLLIAICGRDVDLSFLPVAHGATSFVVYMYLLSILPNIMKYISQISKTVILKVIILMAIGAVISLINSPHYNYEYLVGLKFLISEVGTACLVLPLAFISIRDDKDLIPTIKVAYWGMLLLTTLGIINYITKRSFWVEAMPSFEALFNTMGGNTFAQTDRFRVQSMFQLPFDYGYLCAVMSFFFLYVKRKGLLSRNRFWIMGACCLFGIITCACRSSQAAFAIGIIVYILTAYKLRRSLMYGLIAVLIGIIVIPQIPASQKYIDLFEKGLSTDQRNFEGGSTIGMRLMQLNAVFYYIDDDMLFGRGKGFFYYDMGWENKQYGGHVYDRDLMGLEGAYLNRLLEQGIIGFAIYIIFYSSLFIAAWRMRKSDKLTFALFASVMAAYFSFAQITGELGSVYPSLLLFGISLKLLYVKSGNLFLPRVVRTRIYPRATSNT